MRRIVTAAVCLAALWAGAVAPAQAAPAQTPPVPAAPAPPSLGATLASCVRSPDAAQRSASFTASMPALPGTRRMLLRFDLFQRVSAGEGFTPARVPRWGVWQRSRAGVAGFVFTKHVNGLQAPGEYRAVVRFRWLDARGRVQRTAQRRTRVCHQPDLRPDLRALRLIAEPGPTTDTATYRAVVANRGRGPAPEFAVTLTASGTVLGAERLAPLGPRSRRPLVVSAARCAPGSTLRLTVDSGAEIAEVSEADNVVEAPCPFGAAARSAATLERR
ncbi:MAG TPA: CARDB domain-containing protein [Solirubrobacteraceae bacterium]|nr:CARDB domain-containing protein [Solirubrobacteraceae bacterium]